MASSHPFYDKSSQITENLRYYEYQLTQGQTREINALLDRINFVYHLPVEQCGDKLAVYQTAYNWAYSYEGLKYLSSKAEAFATRISNTLYPAMYLSTFQASYQYGYKWEGLNKTRSSAVEFADKISQYELSHYYPKTKLFCFKERYSFAYKKMNKTRCSSEKYATEACLPSA